jgi:hypothetical protein
MAGTAARSVVNDLIPSRACERRRCASAPRRRVVFTGIYRKGISISILSRLPRLSREWHNRAQLLGEGKWQEIFGFTPT